MGEDSKKDNVISALIQLAGEEQYKIGNRFPPERELAKRLGVGRNVLREAMISLESMGVIEKKERQGVFIKSAITEDIAHNLQYMQALPVEFTPMLMEARMMICVPAVKLAAVRRTEEDLEKLWECYENFHNCPFSTPEEEAVNGKWEALLHHLQTEAAHNPLLSRINESISTLIERNNSIVAHGVMHDNGWFEHIRTQHRQIIEAIEKKDLVLAGKTLREHIIDSYESIKKHYLQQLTESKKLYWEIVD